MPATIAGIVNFAHEDTIDIELEVNTSGTDHELVAGATGFDGATRCWMDKIRVVTIAADVSVATEEDLIE